VCNRQVHNFSSFALLYWISVPTYWNCISPHFLRTRCAKPSGSMSGNSLVAEVHAVSPVMHSVRET